MLESIDVLCPYCGETVELTLAEDDQGSFIVDCEVCCQPWQLTARRDRDGDLELVVERAQ